MDCCRSDGLSCFGSKRSWREGITMKNPLTISLFTTWRSSSPPQLSRLNSVNGSLWELQVPDGDSYFFHLRWNAAFQAPGLSTPTICCLFWLFSLRGRVSKRGKRFRESKWKHSATAKTASIFSCNYLKMMQWDCYWVSLTGKPQVYAHTHTHTPSPGLWARRATIDIQSFFTRQFQCHRLKSYSNYGAKKIPNTSWNFSARNPEQNKTLFIVRCLVDLIKDRFRGG